MVTPGDPSCCRASSPTPDRARFRHRMVRLAPLPPSRSLQGPPETEAATVMLGDAQELTALIWVAQTAGVPRAPAASMYGRMIDERAIKERYAALCAQLSAKR